MPKISVIVPVYKVEQYLNRCVDSILNQTFTDFELILVDDVSPDSCGRICDEYAERDKRIVVIHKENGGLSSARNAGLDWAFANSNSKWITFIDSDDWVHKQYLEILYGAVIENDLSLSICQYVRTDKPIIDEIVEANFELLTPEELWIKNRVNSTIACAKLFKKDLWNKERFPIGRLHEDEFTIYKLLFSQTQIVIVLNELYYYFLNQNSIMNSGFTDERIYCLLEATKEQVNFFQINNYSKLFVWSLNNYLYLIAVHIKMVSEQSNRKLLRYLNKTLKKEMHNYKKIFNIPYTGLFCAQIELVDHNIKKAKISIKIKFLYYLIKEKGLSYIIIKILKNLRCVKNNQKNKI